MRSKFINNAQKCIGNKKNRSSSEWKYSIEENQWYSDSFISEFQNSLSNITFVVKFTSAYPLNA